MSTAGLFTVGLLVTLIVAAAMTLLVWGAVMDGREEDRRRAVRDQHDVDIAGLEAVADARSVA